jgi:TPR repeat protein
VEAEMTKFKFLLFIAVLAGFAARAHAGLNDGKAAYDRGDYATAYKEFKPLAEHGDAEAQWRLGLMYAYGQGVTQDNAKAIKWYRKIYEECKPLAEHGDAKAQFWFGVLYYKGHGVVQDYAEAAKWYRKAAEQGDIKAQGALGMMYLWGEGVPQVPQDDAEGIKWLRKAAEQGGIVGLNFSLGRHMHRAITV